jgi:NADPH-dependent curcumin reductase CurA
MQTILDDFIDKKQYMVPTQLKEPIRCITIEVVENSDNPKYPVGAVIQGLSAMRSHSVYGPEDSPTLIDWTPKSPIPLSAYLTVFSLSGGLTAMMGMTLPHLGNVKAGDVVLVSAAAGHVGQLCCQIARLKGASKVIGIAGGEQNCAFLKNELKVDVAIDYKKGNVEAAIREAAPNRVNLYFDNVGGEITSAALNNMALFGRVIVCGLISTYNEEKTVPAVLSNFQNVLFDRVTVAGFICTDHIAEIPHLVGSLVGWVQSGSMTLPPIEKEVGLENAIRALNRVLKGEKGPGTKMIVAVSPEPSV